MASLEELVNDFAQELQVAITQDQVTRHLMATKSLPFERQVDKSKNVISALVRVNRKIEDLCYPDGKPWSEEHKDLISREIGKKLGSKTPERFRSIFNRASIENGIVIIQEIEDLIKIGK